ncbi:hypothetical protein L7F22_026289 [Adiantum nelumboides]|nr:hypothetical protein [Adiantum nelumboides]
MVRSFFINRKSSSAGGGSQVGECVSEKAKAVLLLLRTKGSPLSAKQLDYCSEACIGRVLKAKGNNIKKAAKQLRATLAWRASLDVDYLTADEFCAELAWGNAYVAGIDEEGRPVLVVRLKPEISTTSQAQKQFIRYFIFTMEVAIACMSSTVEQCVLIVDATACHKRSSAGFSIIMHLLKLLGEHYPERLARSFIVDAPSMFHYLWKGMSKILDLKVREKPKFVFSKQYNSGGSSRPLSSASATANHLMRAAWSYSSRNLWAAGSEQICDDEEEIDQDDEKFVQETFLSSRNAWAARPSSPFPSFTSSSAFNLPSLSSLLSASPPSVPLPSIAASSFLSPVVSIPSSTSSSSTSSSLALSLSSVVSTSSSCSSCSCTLSSSSTSTSSSSSSSSLSSASISSYHHSDGRALLPDNLHARSLSFALAPTCRKEPVTEFRSFRADHRPSRRLNEDGASGRWADVAFGHKNDDFLSQSDYDLDFAHKHKSAALFRPYYVNFLLPPYVESAYRAQMRPPLAGLISIISPDLKLRQPSFSLHSTAMEAMLHHLHFD